MKKQFIFIATALLGIYLLTACGGTLPPTEQASAEQAAVKVQAVEVAFTGVVETINGNDWTVNGQVFEVDPAIVRDGPFQSGDTIKVEGTVNTDGSLSITRVEAPSAADLLNLPQLGNDNVNANDNLNSNDNANTNDSITNTNNDDEDGNVNRNNNANDDSNVNGNSNDDDEDDSNSNGNDNDDDDDDDDDGSGGGSGSNDNDSDDDD